MAEHGEFSASDPLQNRAQVRLFTLADYIADEASGKLYISGAGLEWTEVPARPEPDGDRHLISFALIVRVAFPRAIAKATHIIEVFAFDRAGAPVGPEDAPFVRADMHFNLKRLPSNFTEVSGNVPVQLVDYPVRAGPTEVIFLHLVVDGVLVSRLPMQLGRAPS